MGRFESIQCIKAFMSRFKISESILFPAEVTVFNGTKAICRDICMCKLYYNIPYEQFNIDIGWTIELSELELYYGYNTNFQSFIFNGEYLEIKANTQIICVAFKGVQTK